MGKVLKLEAKRPKPERSDSPLTPELKEFIDRAIVPALVKQYLAAADAQNTLAKPVACVARSVSNSTAAPPREL